MQAYKRVMMTGGGMHLHESLFYLVNQSTISTLYSGSRPPESLFDGRLLNLMWKALHGKTTTK